MYHVRDQHGVLGTTELKRRFPNLEAKLLEKAESIFPVRVTKSWAERIEAHDGPLARQVLPTEEELIPVPADTPDPVGERFRRPVPWVVHKHPDRVLLLVTRRCHLYCRYCFRRDQHDSKEPSTDEMAQAFEYLAQSGAKELILSGGDPLALSNAKIDALLTKGQSLVHRVRIHSRAPITAPHRVNEGLLDVLRKHPPIWMVVHCNHPNELSADVRAALGRLVDLGIPVLNQSVLLKGVNDDPQTLVDLSEALLTLRVHPYYLHHTDPVPGNASFRVSISRGLEIHQEMSRHLGGIGLPRYVIDLPDGSGKVDVAQWATASDLSSIP